MSGRDENPPAFRGTSYQCAASQGEGKDHVSGSECHHAEHVTDKSGDFAMTPMCAVEALQFIFDSSVLRVSQSGPQDFKC